MDKDQVKEIVTAVRETVDDVAKQIDERVDQKLEDVKIEIVKESADVVAKQIDEKVTEKVSYLLNNTKRPEGLEHLDPEKDYIYFSDFAKDVSLAALNKSEPEKLKEYLQRVKAAGTGLLEGTDSYGGYLVPEQFRQELLTVMETKGIIYPRAVKIPMETNTIKIPYLNAFDRSSGHVYGGIYWSWTDELAQLSETRPSFGRTELSLEKITGLAFSSSELLEDSPFSMEMILRRGFSDGLIFALEDAFLAGDGTSVPITGILESSCVYTQAKETGQSADTVVYENIVKMYSHMLEPASAVWIISPAVLPQLMTMMLTDGSGAGGPVFVNIGTGAQQAPVLQLLGRPVFISEFAKALGDEGDIVFANLNYYLIGSKTGPEGARYETSAHLKFDYDQMAFRFVYRVDGAAWMTSTVTLKNGWEVAPFVTLADRA